MQGSRARKLYEPYFKNSAVEFTKIADVSEIPPPLFVLSAAQHRYTPEGTVIKVPFSSDNVTSDNLVYEDTPAAVLFPTFDAKGADQPIFLNSQIKPLLSSFGVPPARVITKEFASRVGQFADSALMNDLCDDEDNCIPVPSSMTTKNISKAVESVISAAQLSLAELPESLDKCRAASASLCISAGELARQLRANSLEEHASCLLNIRQQFRGYMEASDTTSRLCVNLCAQAIEQQRDEIAYLTETCRQQTIAISKLQECVASLTHESRLLELRSAMTRFDNDPRILAKPPSPYNGDGVSSMAQILISGVYLQSEIAARECQLFKVIAPAGSKKVFVTITAPVAARALLVASWDSPASSLSDPNDLFVAALNGTRQQNNLVFASLIDPSIDADPIPDITGGGVGFLNNSSHTGTSHMDENDHGATHHKAGRSQQIATESAIASNNGKFPSNADCLTGESEEDQLLLSENSPIDIDGAPKGACGTAILAVVVDTLRRKAPSCLYVCLSLDPRLISRASLQLGYARRLSEDGKLDSDSLKKNDLRQDLEFKEASEQAWKVVTGQQLVGVPSHHKIDKARYSIGCHIQRKLLDNGNGPEKQVSKEEEDETALLDVDMSRKKRRELKANSLSLEAKRKSKIIADMSRYGLPGMTDKPGQYDTFDADGAFIQDSMKSITSATAEDDNNDLQSDSSRDLTSSSSSPNSRSPAIKSSSLFPLPPIPPSGAEMTDFAIKTRLREAGIIDDDTLQIIMSNGAQAKETHVLEPGLFQALNVEIASGLLTGSGRKSVGSQTVESTIFSDKHVDIAINNALQESVALLKEGCGNISSGIGSRLQEIILENHRRKRAALRLKNGLASNIASATNSDSHHFMSNHHHMNINDDSQEAILQQLSFERAVRAESALALSMRARELARISNQERLKPKLADFTTLLPLSRLSEIGSFARWPRGLCQAAIWVIFLHRTVHLTLDETIISRRAASEKEYHMLLLKTAQSGGDPGALGKLYKSLFKGSLSHDILSDVGKSRSDSLATFTADWMLKRAECESLSERMLMSFVKSISGYHGLVEIEGLDRDAAFRSAFGEPPAAPDWQEGSTKRGMFGISASGGDFSYLLEVFCHIVGLSGGCSMAERKHLERFVLQMLRSICKQLKSVENAKSIWTDTMISKANSTRMSEVSMGGIRSPFNQYKRKLQVDLAFSDISNLMLSVGTLSSNLELLPKTTGLYNFKFENKNGNNVKNTVKNTLGVNSTNYETSSHNHKPDFINSKSPVNPSFKQFHDTNQSEFQNTFNQSIQSNDSSLPNNYFFSTNPQTPINSVIPSEALPDGSMIIGTPWNVSYLNDSDPISTLLAAPYDPNVISEMFNATQLSRPSVKSFDRNLLDQFSLWEPKKLILPVSAAIRAVLETFRHILQPLLGGSGLLPSDALLFMSFPTETPVTEFDNKQRVHSAAALWLERYIASPALQSAIARVSRYICEHFSVAERSKELKRIRNNLRAKALEDLEESSSQEAAAIDLMNKKMEAINAALQSKKRKKRKSNLPEIQKTASNIELNDSTPFSPLPPSPLSPGIMSPRSVTSTRRVVMSPGTRSSSSRQGHRDLGALAKESILVKHQLAAAVESAQARREAAESRLKLIDAVDEITFESLSAGGERIFDNWKPTNVNDARVEMTAMQMELENHPFKGILQRQSDKLGALLLSECYLPVSVEPLLRVCINEWEVFHRRMQRQVNYFLRNLIIVDHPLSGADEHSKMSLSQFRSFLMELDKDIPDVAVIDIMRELRDATPPSESGRVSIYALSEVFLRHSSLLHRLFRLALTNSVDPPEPNHLPIDLYEDGVLDSEDVVDHNDEQRTSADIKLRNSSSGGGGQVQNKHDSVKRSVTTPSNNADHTAMTSPRSSLRAVQPPMRQFTGNSSVASSHLNASLKRIPSTNQPKKELPIAGLMTVESKLASARAALNSLKIPLDATFERAMLEFLIDGVDQWTISSTSSYVTTDQVLVACVNPEDSSDPADVTKKTHQIGYSISGADGRHRVLANLTNRLQASQNLKTRLDEASSLLQISRQWLQKPSSPQVFSETWRALRTAIGVLISTDKSFAPSHHARERSSMPEALAEVDCLSTTFESECMKVLVRSVGPQLLDQWMASNNGGDLITKLREFMKQTKEFLLLGVSSASQFEGLSENVDEDKFKIENFSCKDSINVFSSI